ncbi:DUF6093 family protein [Streptomyces mirabilis]|uniref:DUF6093 family protein n=1 Tax=Streptomyces mirabilis TaxID=68239 RepID=UPI0033BB707C
MEVERVALARSDLESVPGGGTAAGRGVGLWGLNSGVYSGSWRRCSTTSCSCGVTRRGGRTTSSTGRLVSPAADCELVQEGHGAVVPVGQGVMVAPLDGALASPSVDTAYKVLLPLAAPPTRRGDLLILVRSLRHPQLVGRRFLVGDAPVGMSAVVRTVRLQAVAAVGGEEGR